MSIEEILQEVQHSYLRIKQAEARARYGYEHYLDDLKAIYTQQLQEIENSFRQTSQQVHANYQQQIATTYNDFEQARQHTHAQLASMADTFHWAVSPWDDPAWDTYEPISNASAPSNVRIGRLDLEGIKDFPQLPALAAFIGHESLFIIGEQATVPVAQQLLQTITLRLVVSFPPGTLRLRMADPLGQGNTLAAFMHLPPALRGDTICYRPEDIEKLLHTVSANITDIIQNRLRNVYATIEEYNQQTSGVSVPYMILVLSDFPAGFSDRMVELLTGIARNGSRAGVYVLATINPSYPLPRDWNLTNLTDLGSTLHITAPTLLVWNDKEFGQYPVVPDTMPEAARVNGWLEAVRRAFEQTSTVVPFNRIAIPASNYWTGKTFNGLVVSIGISGTGETHFFEIGTGTVHHGLIGGQIGSGKSNLLHVLIMQLALNYPPEELEMYLVDFKEGVEFQDYITLPHARVVALESEREFGLSILRRLETTMEERGTLFKAAGVGTRDAYCQHTGKPMPRILLIMDEFQVLFRLDDAIAREAERILEDLVRRSRAFGIHVLLSSQSPSAMLGIVQGRNIYNQMGLRIAFRCLAQDAMAILGENNDAAKRLERPGEAIYNDMMGEKEKNTFLRVASLNQEERRHILLQIQALADRRQQAGYSYPPPVTFERKTPAQLEDNPSLKALLAQSTWPSKTRSAKVWLGQPIEIKEPTNATLSRDIRSNLLILGDNEQEAYGLLLAAFISLTAQKSPIEAAFFIAEFAKTDSPVAGLFSALKGLLPHTLEVAGPNPKAVGAIVTQLFQITNQRVNGEIPADQEIYFFVAGMQRWRELRSIDYDQTEAAVQLVRIAEDGPEVGVHVIAWADSMGTLEQTIKRNGISSFDLRAILHVSEQDSINLLSSPAAARLEDNRAFYRNEDWSQGKMEKFKPYSLPAPQALAKLLNDINTKGVQ